MSKKNLALCLVILCLCPTWGCTGMFPSTGVTKIDDSTYHITSSGHDAFVAVGEARSHAFKKANKVCPGGFDIVSTEATNMGRRTSVEIIVKCRDSKNP